MTHNPSSFRLPRPASLGLAGLLAVAIGASSASTALCQAGTAPSANQGRAGEAQTATQPTGKNVLQQAVTRLEQYGGIGARVRYRVVIFDQTLIGSGNYYQGPAGTRQSRIELKVQAANKTCSHLQVCDGQTLWTYQQYPESRSLTRVNVDEVLAALAKRKNPSPPMALGIGGLPEMLRCIEQSFDFADPQPGKLGEWPVLRLTGTFKPEMLAKLLPKQQKAIEAGEKPDLSDLPGQSPCQVVLYLGQADLFPYRLEYDRAEVGDQDEPMLVMEFFEVQFNLAVDPERFAYKPSYRNVQDITGQYIQQLR